MPTGVSRFAVMVRSLMLYKQEYPNLVPYVLFFAFFYFDEIHTGLKGVDVFMHEATL